MMEQLKHQLSDKRVSGLVKLTLDVENTVTKRNGKLHLDPFEPDNTLVMVGMLDALTVPSFCVVMGVWIQV